MLPEDEKFRRTVKAPDMSNWPFDTPWIMSELRVRGLTVVNAASLKPAEIYDSVGATWRYRALRAEAHLRDSIIAAEKCWRSIVRETLHKVRIGKYKGM